MGSGRSILFQQTYIRVLSGLTAMETRQLLLFVVANFEGCSNLVIN